MHLARFMHYVRHGHDSDTLTWSVTFQDVTSGALNASFSVLPPIASTGSGKQTRKLGELEEITLQ